MLRCRLKGPALRSVACLRMVTGEDDGREGTSIYQEPWKRPKKDLRFPGRAQGQDHFFRKEACENADVVCGPRIGKRDPTRAS